MPEEINRIVTDSISDYSFVTEKSSIENLLKKGKPEDKIHFETFEKCSILVRLKEGENFNRKNILNILRIKI